MDNYNIRVLMLEDLHSPEDTFIMVMEYAKMTKKNPWKCMGQVFNPNNLTAVLLDLDGLAIGYSSGYITPDDDLFLHHGYCRRPLNEMSKIFDRMCLTQFKRAGIKPTRVICHSDLPEKLWVKRYGYKVSDEKIFIKNYQKEE